MQIKLLWLARTRRYLWSLASAQQRRTYVVDQVAGALPQSRRAGVWPATWARHAGGDCCKFYRCLPCRVDVWQLVVNCPASKRPTPPRARVNSYVRELWGLCLCIAASRNTFTVMQSQTSRISRMLVPLNWYYDWAVMFRRPPWS